jgi:hypothetical protein
LRTAVISLLFAGCILPATGAAGSPGIWRNEHALEDDRRVVKDRLHPAGNPDHRDASFLNAVGAVWPYGIDPSPHLDASTGHDAATGFLIDRCHVLTSMHAVYTGDVIANPPAGKPVAFAVGQTESDKDRGAIQGLRFLMQGVVVAHGGSIILDKRVHDPENDWAVIRLAADVDGAISPMTIAAVDIAQLAVHHRLFAAGFPTDHRTLRADGFKLKDLWGSEGDIVGIDPSGSGAALIQTTIQTTPGDSGGPVYGDFGGREHVVIGMIQGYRGNGIDTRLGAPNAQILLTGATLAAIGRARELSPCR